MKILHFSVGDRIEMRKIHPCGGRLFRVMRVGSDIRIICEKCGRDLTLPREKLEKAAKKIIPSEKENGE